MHDKLRVIVDNLKQGNQEWFLINGIATRDKGDYWMLNYQQIANKNEYNVLTRGLVVSKTGDLTSIPFFRFFNYGEPLAAKVDFSNADVMEKLDGSLVGVCFPEKDVTNPVWHFRSLISASPQDRNFKIQNFIHGDESVLLDEVEPYLDDIEFTEDLKDYTLIFEFISQCNAVVTRYEPKEYGLYLIGARHLPTLNELSEDELDSLATVIRVRRPRRWNADSYEQVLAEMAKFPKDKVYEGFIIRDRKTGQRIKIKNEDYLKRHRLLDKLSYKNLVPLWFAGEQDEILSYFPKTKEIFKKIEEAVQVFVDKAVKELHYWQHREGTRKDKALGIQATIGKHPTQSIVFKFLENKDEKDVIRKKTMDYLREMAETRVRVLIEHLGLKDDVIEGVVSEMIG